MLEQYGGRLGGVFRAGNTCLYVDSRDGLSYQIEYLGFHDKGVALVGLCDELRIAYHVIT